MEVSNINLFLKNAILLLAVTFFFSIDASAQRFRASGVFGLNLSQIDGDAKAGFSKLGLTGGLKLAYPLKKHTDVNLEMLYSQRGSTTGFGFGSEPDIFTDVKYIELPLYVNIKDWYIEEGDYHKVKAHAGLTYAYLFAVESNSQLLSNDIDNYNRNDIGYLLGLTYAFNSHFGMTVRYTRSFNSLFLTKAISYFVTIRTEYTF